ncbi:MAG: GNAT family N-acetyltransferase [Candidatus Bathyarchaeia archaeon]|jgi:GNAT superfamily N-acetyltransferase
MIYQLATADIPAILSVVNSAAIAYKGKIPSDAWKEPYMPEQELEEEIRSGVKFYGCKDNDVLMAVMGIQRVRDVTLIRHAYVLPAMQRRGLGQKLLEHLMGLAATRQVYVGTWETASWAVKFYEKNRFQLVPSAEKNRLLRTYWRISERQVETSVVLKLKRQLR